MRVGNIDFPIRETYFDAASQRVEFEIDVQPTMIPGFTLSAVEINPDREGYAFEVYTESNVPLALDRIRDVIRRGISTKYLSGSYAQTGLHSTSHDVIRGRISHDGVVIDGELFSFGDFGELLQTGGYFYFEMRLAEESDGV